MARMLRAFWQSVACSESGLEFLLLLPTIVIFPEIFTSLFLCKGKPAALQLYTLPSAGKNTLFVFTSIHSSWNLLVMIIKQYIQDQQVSLENLQARLWVWHVNWSVRMLNCLSKSQPCSITAPAASTCRTDKESFRHSCHCKDRTSSVSRTTLYDRNTKTSADWFPSLLKALNTAPHLPILSLFYQTTFSFQVNSRKLLFQMQHSEHI